MLTVNKELTIIKKVKVSNDKEIAQTDRNSKNPGGERTNLAMRAPTHRELIVSYASSYFTVPGHFARESFLPGSFRPGSFRL